MNWLTASKANLLLSFRALAQLVTFIAILPLLDNFISKKLGLSARVKDLLLSRLSIGSIMICFAILVIAPSIPVIVVGKHTSHPTILCLNPHVQSRSRILHARKWLQLFRQIPFELAG